MQRYQKSKELYERACRSLAGGVSSEFRKYSYPHPLFYVGGSGSHVTDADGNDYLDFTLSQGPLILGHSHPEVLARVEEASRTGQLYAGQHLQELELAETLQRILPCADLLRMSLSGSEAVHAALRLARVVTGRDKFLKFEGHYHGWLDSVCFSVAGAEEEALGPREAPQPVAWSEGLARGSEDRCLVLPWNDLPLATRTIEQHADDLAAVITSPAMCNAGCIAPADGFLEGLRAACDAHGVVLIFDEVITGFRLALGGGAAHYGVTPDVAIYGKALASGYPISVLAGREQFMRPVAEGRAIHAGTMNSGVPSVAAAAATLEVLERDAVHQRIWALGEQLAAGLRDAAQRAGQPLLVQDIGPVVHAGFTPLDAVKDYRDTLRYDKAKYAQFVGRMHDRGIRLIGRGIWYLSGAHTEAEIDESVAAAHEVLKGL